MHRVSLLYQGLACKFVFKYSWNCSTVVFLNQFILFCLWVCCQSFCLYSGSSAFHFVKHLWFKTYTMNPHVYILKWHLSINFIVYFVIQTSLSMTLRRLFLCVRMQLMLQPLISLTYTPTFWSFSGTDLLASCFGKEQLLPWSYQATEFRGLCTLPAPGAEAGSILWYLFIDCIFCL